MSYELYGANVSPFVRKVRILCTEKDVDYTLIPINPFDPPADYRNISPLGKIPAFRDGDRTLADSSIICTYIERRHPQPAMYPADDYEFARALWFEEYIDSALVPKLGGGVFFPLVAAPRLMNQPVTDETHAAVRKTLEEDVHPMWDYLESELGDSEWFVGGQMSIADITVASSHVNLMHAGHSVPAERWPRLSAFLDRVHARPSFAAIIAEEKPDWSIAG